MELPVNIKSDLSESTNLVLKELSLPASTQIGQALGNIFGILNTVTLPIKLANEYAQRNYQKLSEKINDIPKENIKQAEPEIAIPLMEKLSYTSNEELANAYSSLLANACNKEKIDLIHPGFIQKIQNMAPDEIKILEYIRQNKYFDIPYIIFKSVENKSGNYKNLSIPLSGLDKKLNLNPYNIIIHINNLISLSILSDNLGHYKIDSTLYDSLKSLYQEDEKIYLESTQKLEEHSLEIEKSFYSVTQLGQVFIKACTN